MDDPTATLVVGFALALFALGLYAVATREGLLRVLLGMEIMGKGVTLTFIASGYALGRMATAQALVFTVIVVEVVVTAVALAFLIRVQHTTGRMDVAAVGRLVG